MKKVISVSVRYENEGPDSISVDIRANYKDEFNTEKLVMLSLRQSTVSLRHMRDGVIDSLADRSIESLLSSHLEFSSDQLRYLKAALLAAFQAPLDEVGYNQG